MPERSLRSHLVAAAGGLLVIASATAAHMAAGGTVDVYALIGLATLSVALSTTLASRVRLTFARAITATLLLQPVMHQMLGHRSAVPNVATGHMDHSMDHAMPMPETSTHIGSSMVASHAAVALLCAVALRWGIRWLRSMPMIGRALVLRARTAVVPMLTVGATAPATPDVVVAPFAVLFAWDTRGPPH